MKKNLVMGSASGFDWDTLEPFVTSFVRHVKNAELVLFLKDTSDFTLDRLKRCGKGALKIELFDYREFKNIGIDRFKNFKRYIDAHGDNYEQIFITDTRDVIFQSDVFECFKGYFNFLGYSSEGDDIRGSKKGHRLNYNWIANIFGKEEADKLLDKKSICAGGALIGTSREVNIFLEILLSNKFPNEKYAFDQAAFNYLFHNNLVPIKNIIESDLESGAIFNMALADNFYVRGDKIFRNGSFPAVVHQYDRHKSLIQFVNEVYRDKNFQFDERFTDTHSVIEQTISLLRVNKTGEATRLFLKEFLSKAYFNGYNKILIKIWDNASKKPLSKSLEFLELAVQEVLKSVKTFSNVDFSDICRLLKYAEQNGRPVDLDFKIYIANFLWEIAKQHLESNQPKVCFEFIKFIEEIGMPPDKNFYLFVAKANRIFGRKDEALAAYKRALELS